VKRSPVLVLIVGAVACARHEPVVTPPAPPPVAGKEGPCPDGMALVSARFCIDRWEASLVEAFGAEERPFSPYESPDGRVVRAVTVAGLVPQGYVSRDQAETACKASHKRLCREDEWVAACKGDPPHAFPYGNVREKGACNDSGISPLRVFYADSAEMYRSKPMNDPRLNQQPRTLAKAGAFARCTNGFGVFDMVGNLHEWVMSRRPTFRGGYYQDTHLNGDGCDYRTTAHQASYHDYSTGFRCCTDPQREN
jgi:sulfatase-modifying factor enzyme 1